MTKVRHTTIKHTNYIPTYQLQGKNNHNKKLKRLQTDSYNSKTKNPKVYLDPVN